MVIYFVIEKYNHGLFIPTTAATATATATKTRMGTNRSDNRRKDQKISTVT